MTPVSRLALYASAALSLLLPQALTGQSGVTLSGRVASADGIPLPAIDVRVEGTGHRTVTDESGRFVFAGGSVSEGQVLVIRGLGYETRRVPVPASRAALEIRLEADPLLIEGLDVRGQRLGQALALQQQRSAGNLRNVVAAERIGRFPDPNAAEALQRLPGVAVARDQGEGRYVLVRGTDPRFSTISINGARLPVPEGEGRLVALDVIPSDILGSIEVSKSLTPDMDGDAIGGAIELRTRAASFGEDAARFTLATGRNSLAAQDISQFAGHLSRRFGAERRFGLVLAASRYHTDRATDNVETSWDEAFGQDVLDDLELRDYAVSRTRTGGMATLEYVFPDERSSFRLTGVFNDYQDQEYRRRSRLRFGDGDYQSASAVSDASIERELKDRYERQRIWSASAAGSQALGVLSLDYALSLSRAEEAQPDRSDITLIQEGVDMGFDVSDPWRPSYQVTAGEEFDAGAFEFDELVLEDNLTDEEALSAALDLRWPVAEGLAVKVGGKFRENDKRRVNDIRVFDGFATALGLDALAPSQDDRDFFLGQYRVGPIPGPEETRRFTRDNFDAFELDGDGSREDTDPANYEARERIGAVYLMAELEVGKLQLIPGLRLERSRLDYTGNEVVFDEGGDYLETNPVSASEGETHLLPGLTLRYRLGELTNLRGAVTRSLARPDYFDLVPYRLVNREDEEVELGNERLRATTSTNLDLSFEKFDQAVGVLSAGFFYKALDRFVYRSRFDVSGGGLDGFAAVQPANGGDGHLWGIEVDWVRQLHFLPGLLNGLSVHANYTFTESELSLPDRETATLLPGQASHLGNLALAYEKGPWSGRIAMHHRGSYVAEIGESAGDDIYLDGHSQLDFAASYRITSQAQLFVEAINLTNEPLRAYQGAPSRPVQQEYYSWWGHLGMKLSVR